MSAISFSNLHFCLLLLRTRARALLGRGSFSLPLRAKKMLWVGSFGMTPTRLHITIGAFHGHLLRAAGHDVIAGGVVRQSNQCHLCLSLITLPVRRFLWPSVCLPPRPSAPFPRVSSPTTPSLLPFPVRTFDYELRCHGAVLVQCRC